MKMSNLQKSIIAITIFALFFLVVSTTVPALACDSDPSMADSCDPDIMPEENHEAYNPEHFEGMPQPAENQEEYNESHFEGMRPEEYDEEHNEEYFEEVRPEEDHREMRFNAPSQRPYTAPMMPSYIWIIIALGVLVLVTLVILIIVISRKKQRGE